MICYLVLLTVGVSLGINGAVFRNVLLPMPYDFGSEVLF